VPASLGCCNLLSLKSLLQTDREICAYTEKNFAWAHLHKIQFALFSKLWGNEAPRILFAETLVENEPTLIVCFRETKGKKKFTFLF